MRKRRELVMFLAVAVIPAGIAAAQLVIRFDPVQPDLFGAGATFTNAWADYDADGDPDLFVGFDGPPNRLYRNDQGVFADVAAQAGVADARPTRAAAWADFDGDGDADLLVGFAPGDGQILRLYRNDSGRFSDVTAAAGLAVTTAGAVRQPAFVDYDVDGDLDLFVAFRDRANALFRNDAGTFVDVAGSVGLADTRRTVGAVWADFDLDGDPDLAVGNMDGDANALMRNDAGRFIDVAAAPESGGIQWGGRSAGDKTNGTVRPCAADVNNDGLVDLFMANYGKNGLFLNRGGWRFDDAGAAWGVATDARFDSCAFADFDSDGNLDVYVNGTVTGGKSYPDYLLRNMRDRFVDVTPDNIRALEADHGAAWADFDLDGDEDLALTGAQKNGMHLLMRNQQVRPAKARPLQLRVLDAAGRRTRAGAVVSVRGTGFRTTLLVDGGTGYNSQSDLPLQVAFVPGDAVVIETQMVSKGKTLTMTQSVDMRTVAGRVIDVRPRAPTLLK